MMKVWNNTARRQPVPRHLCCTRSISHSDVRVIVDHRRWPKAKAQISGTANPEEAGSHIISLQHNWLDTSYFRRVVCGVIPQI